MDSQLDFAKAIQVGSAADLLDTTREGGPPEIPSSEVPRGLAVSALQVHTGWEGLRRFLQQHDQVYFLSVAFDLSENKPVVLPPKEVSAESVYSVPPGDNIEFTLGDGAPVFPARVIHGGLLVYVTVCEADSDVRQVGEVLAKIHDDLSKDDSILALVKKLIRNPAQTVADELLGVATAALKPIGTILAANKDDHVALFSGIYPAQGSWDGRLSETRNGATIRLRELR